MRRVIYVILGLLIVLGLGKACIKEDIELSEKPVSTELIQNTQADYPAKKNITINEVDYLQSQAAIGEFGGTFVSSTIGEGPKTFNAFMIWWLWGVTTSIRRQFT